LEEHGKGSNNHPILAILEEEILFPIEMIRYVSYRMKQTKTV
jgi:hypothetical protein